MVQPAPRRLGPRGRRLWREAAATRTFGPGERVLLEEACRLVDRLEVLDAQIRGEAVQHTIRGMTITLETSAPQQEARLSVVALRNALMSLGLDRSADVVPPAQQRPAKKAAVGKDEPADDDEAAPKRKDPISDIERARARRAADGR